MSKVGFPNHGSPGMHMIPLCRQGRTIDQLDHRIAVDRKALLALRSQLPENGELGWGLSMRTARYVDRSTRDHNIRQP